MNLAISKAVRLSLIAFGMGAFFQACGSVNEGTVTVIDAKAGNGATGGDDSTGGTPAAQGGDQNMPQAGETNGAGGAMSELCEADKPCLNGPDPGLCVDGTCTGCISPDDDSACQDTYGAKYLCLNGGCVETECSSDDDCDGATCLDNHCVPCTSDSDCPEPDTICNVSTGGCVTNDSCGAASGGDACPVNDQDKCCGSGSPVCEAVECCGTGPCKTDSNAASNDGTCKSGTCVLVGCNTPPPTIRFVDFAGAPGGGGSKDCPYTRLAQALDDLVNTGGTVIIKGDSLTTVDSTATVGPGITITGSDSNFEPCTPATCASNAKWPQITTGDRRALNMLTAGNRTIRFLRLVGVKAADFQTAQWAAVYASAATVSVDHMEISGYQYGLYADTGGSLEVGGGLRAHHNRTGLYVESGEASVGGSATVQVAAGGDPISFDSNNFGMVVHGNGILQVIGPPFAAKARGLISANDNGGSGVYFPASNVKGLLDGLEAANNGGDTTLGSHDGATVFAHAVVKIRNSYFHDNVASGINIPANGPNTADGLSKIDLGKDKKSNPGLNTFVGNDGAGICVAPGPAGSATANSLQAQGNYFRTLDCTGTGTYTRRGTCTGGVDYSGDCQGAADLLGCTPPTIKCVP